MYYIISLYNYLLTFDFSFLTICPMWNCNAYVFVSLQNYNRVDLLVAQENWTERGSQRRRIRGGLVYSYFVHPLLGLSVTNFFQIFTCFNATPLCYKLLGEAWGSNCIWAVAQPMQRNFFSKCINLYSQTDRPYFIG